MDKKEYQIMAHIIEARGLAALDSTNTSDPIASVSVGPVAGIYRQTECKSKTVNALWESKYLFEGVKLSEDEFDREKLVFEVVDRNDWGKNETIGSYEFSLSNINRQASHQYFRQWVPLKLPDDPTKNQGYLLISCHVLKEGDETPSAIAETDDKKILVDPALDEGIGYVLNVLIYRAQDILSTHGLGSMDPFVSVRFNGNQIQTAHISNSINPIWNRKFEMPFSQPLTSDSIEIQLWNHRSMLPDQLIGQFNDNYFSLQLTHKDFGPKWINLYSNVYQPDIVSYTGSMKDSLSQTRGLINLESEYVGRVLVRMSVSQREIASRAPPRLKDMPCNPTADPKGGIYVINWYLYASSEIPVLGGHVMVELVFGGQRQRSRWMLGREGVFRWDQQFTIKQYAPLDKDQCHDVIINVYHRVGNSIRKIGFERIRSVDLCKDEDKYYINGEKVDEVKSLTSRVFRGCWHSLRHVIPDPQNPHVLAGFLNMCIGMGLESVANPNPPRLITSEMATKNTYILRSEIYMAGNLPAASSWGHSDPHLVLRFGNSTMEFPTRLGTTFPIWNMCGDMAVKFNDKMKHSAPCLYIMMYHKTLSEYVLLGRCQVLASDIFGTGPGVKHRYYLEPPQTTAKESKMSQLQSGVPKGIRGGDPPNPASAPYIVANFALFEETKVPKVPDMFRNKVKTRENQHNWRQLPTLNAALKVECLGVRKLPFGEEDEETKVIVEMSVPAIPVPCRNPGGDKEVYQFPQPDSSTPGVNLPWNMEGYDEPAQFRQEFESNSKFVSGRSCQMLKGQVIPNVEFPLVYPQGLPLRIRLASSSGGDERTELGCCWRPLLSLLDDKTYNRLHDEMKFPPVPSWYHMGQHSFHEDGFNLESDIEDEEDRMTDAKHHGDEKKDDEKVMVIDDDDGAPVGYLDDTGVVIDDEEAENWGLDIDEVNVEVNPRTFEVKNDDGAMMGYEEEEEEMKGLLWDDNDGKDDADIKEEIKRRHDAILPKDLHVWQGKTIALTDTASQLFQLNAKNSSLHKGTVKFYINMKHLSEDENRRQEQLVDFRLDGNRLDDIRHLYTEPWVARLYVYNAMNLTPRDRRFGAHQTANPFLVVKNGVGTGHEFNTRPNYISSDLNPNFQQVFELVSIIPENNNLDISVWDADRLTGDDLIGNTTIDLESLILLGDTIGPKQPYNLSHPGSANYQGKLFMKLHLLGQEEARRKKAEEIATDPKEEYELRMVVWSSRNIRFGDNKKKDEDVDQRIVVISNFEGLYGNDTRKQTDVAWYSQNGEAEWNWRMKWPVTLPAKTPRLKIQMFDENVTTDAEVIGECIYNLAPFFDRAKRFKQTISHEPADWCPLVHPDFPDVESLGELNLEFWLIQKVEATKNPVGEAQDAPNESPFLAKPHRNPPPWAILSQALDFGLNPYVLAAIVVVLLIIVAIVALVFLSQSGML